MKGICEFCGQDRELGSPTPFHGAYCLDCMRMNIEYDKDSIAEMKPKRKKRVTKDDISELERQKDEALNELINYST